MPVKTRVRLFMTDLQTATQADTLRQTLAQLPDINRIDIEPRYHTAVVVGSGLEAEHLSQAVNEAGLTLISSARLLLSGHRAPLYHKTVPVRRGTAALT
jgi:hypothetical protein